MLEVNDLHAGYEGTEIVHGVSFTVADGEYACIIGANGCGKTTTLKTILGLLRAMSGSVKMDGVETSGLAEQESARLFAYIPQVHQPPFPFKVADVVLMGRTPHLATMSRVSAHDRDVAFESMRRMGVLHLADREYTALSGGQRQLVLIARALCQEPRLLVMDEPTASLDYGNQELVLSTMRDLSLEGMGVLMVTHDPDHALYCADKVIVMEEGTIIDTGSPQETITEENLNRIYGIPTRVLDVEVAPGEQRRVCIML
jgi:iron complex transport system ATP-binding protein